MQLWPVLASWFKLDVGPSLHIPLTRFMPHHKDLWASIVKRHNLKDIPFEKVSSPLPYLLSPLAIQPADCPTQAAPCCELVPV